MPAEPKVTLEKILQLIGFPASVEEHHMEDGILLDVKTDDSGRLIDFVVAKTNDQEENVVARTGFTVRLSFGPLL